MIDIDRVAAAIWRAQYHLPSRVEFEPALFTRETYHRMAQAAIDSLDHMVAVAIDRKLSE